MKMFCRQMTALIRLSFLELWRRNDVFGLLVLSLALMVPLALAKPFGAAGASRYLDEVALLLIWGFSLFVALGTGARLFPPEFESRTIYPLLSKPISRARLLIGKYLGAVAATWSALTVFYVLFFVSLGLRGGRVFTLDNVQAVALHLAGAALTVALSLSLSFLLTRSATLTLGALMSVGMFFFGRNLPHYAESVATPLAVLLKVLYVICPHVEFFDMRQRLIHGWGAVDGLVFAAAIGYAVVYVGFLLFMAHAVLKKRQ